jgi:hypothetical protein
MAENTTRNTWSDEEKTRILNLCTTYTSDEFKRVSVLESIDKQNLRNWAGSVPHKILPLLVKKVRGSNTPKVDPIEAMLLMDKEAYNKFTTARTQLATIKGEVADLESDLAEKKVELKRKLAEVKATFS